MVSWTQANKDEAVKLGNTWFHLAELLLWFHLVPLIINRRSSRY